MSQRAAKSSRKSSKRARAAAPRGVELGVIVGELRRLKELDEPLKKRELEAAHAIAPAIRQADEEPEYAVPLSWLDPDKTPAPDYEPASESEKDFGYRSECFSCHSAAAVTAFREPLLSLRLCNAHAEILRAARALVGRLPGALGDCKASEERFYCARHEPLVVDIYR
jgi:hypothetical protein